MSIPLDTKDRIVWKINFKNGSSVDLPLKNGDTIDDLLNAWISDLADGKKKVFQGALNEMQLWINPEEVVIASRAIVRAKPEIPRSDKVVSIDMPADSFQRVD